MLGFELVTGCATRLGEEITVIEIFKRETYNQSIDLQQHRRESEYSRPTRCVLQVETSGVRERKCERGWAGRLVCSIPSIRDATGCEVAPTAAHSASRGSQGERQPATDQGAHLNDVARDIVLIGAGWGP